MLVRIVLAVFRYERTIWIILKINVKKGYFYFICTQSLQSQYI